MSGLFITFEGGEGVGKTTLIKHLETKLSSLGYTVLCTREPGGTAFAERLRAILVDEELDAWTESLLYAAARSDHVRKKIIPALQAGAIVLCDRYFDSTLAYQGGGHGLDLTKLKQLCRLATHGLKPKLTLLLDGEPENTLHKATVLNRFERSPLDFHVRVRKTFLKLAKSEPKRFVIFKAHSSPAEVLAERFLRKSVSPFLNKLPRKKGNQ